MKLLILVLTVIGISITACYGQIDVEFYGYNLNHKHKEIKKDSTGRYCVFEADTNYVVFYSHDYMMYKLFYKGKLKVEGSLGGIIYSDYFKQFGKWTEYYENGNEKKVGYYSNNNPIGTWEVYYEDGKIKEQYTLTPFYIDSTLTICKVGLYQLYYETGQLFVVGNYMVEMGYGNSYEADSFTYENEIVVRYKPVSKKTGLWLKYDKTGSISEHVVYD